MKFELTEDIKKEIDSMLTDLLNGNSFSENKENTELQKVSIRICKALNLIKLSNNGKQFELSEKSIFVLQDGGIEKYLFNEKTEKNIDSDIKDLTLKKLRFEQFPTKFWWLILIIAGTISILTTWANNQISKLENQQEPQKTEILLQK
jgi:hypothetical protein